jgi:DNA polymerase III delta prime subunit
MSIQIHKNITDKLQYFYNIGKIPHIIFNGPSGSGKSTIMNNFINLIYNQDKDKINDFVMYVNCAHGKGIKFIRDELKFFAKTHINSNDGDTFKSIILLNGDKLTTDAQSALRRCIELFSHNTRFFIIVEDKYKLLKPILSRFCEIYVPEPEIDGKIINLYKYNLQKTFNFNNIKSSKIEWLKKEIIKNINQFISLRELIEFIEKLYDKAYSALDLIQLIEAGNFNLDIDKRYELLIAFNKIKREFRSEKLLIFFIINFTFLDLKYNVENITFM